MNKTRGFTIVELLIVIVVIGILAAITIVAFNGIQTRANNAKSAAAIKDWVKIIKLHYADKGVYPATSSCLGSSTTYPDNAQCWDSTGWRVQSSFLTEIAPYVSGNYPEPDVADIQNGGAGSPKRGGLYIAGSRNVYLMQNNVSTCPNIGESLTGTQVYGTGVRCAYTLPAV